MLVYVGQQPLVFLINSNISTYIRSKPDLSNCQVKLEVGKNSFLDHDSYLDCSNVFDNFSDKDILDAIASSPDAVQGELSKKTTRLILKVVKGAKSISPRHKQLIINSF